jgi:hypothetical protein
MIPLLTVLTGQWRLIAAGGAALLVLTLLGLWRLEAGHVRQLQAQVAVAQAAQKDAQAQADAASDAEAVVADGAARDLHTDTVHEENSHAIDAASGAGQSLDPDLNTAGRLGLCGYAAYADDPACLQLRGDGSRQRPQAGGADGPAAP